MAEVSQVKSILNPLAQGGDFSIVEIEAKAQEYTGYMGQQTRAIWGDHFKDRGVGLTIITPGGLSYNGKVFKLP